MSLFDLLFSKKPTTNQNSNKINIVPLPSKGECYAVIDTETTWNDEVMSIGIVIADSYERTHNYYGKYHKDLYNLDAKIKIEQKKLNDLSGDPAYP